MWTSFHFFILAHSFTHSRHLKVAPRTVALWVTDLAEALPNAPMPEEVKEAEMDELFTFIGDKKTESTLSLW